MIVDANILVSAAIGRSYPDLRAWRDMGISLKVPARQWRETELVLRHKMGLALDEVATQMAKLDLIVERLEPSIYEPHELRARGRLGDGGQTDWPVLASAIALGDAIVSNDRDFFGVGVTVWSRSVLKHDLETWNG